MDERRLQVLLDRYFDQLLALDERKELELMLLAFPRARELFWEAARMNALVRSWGEAEWGRQEALLEKLRAVAPAPDGFRQTASRRVEHFRRILLRWVLPACATALVVFGGIAIHHVFFNKPDEFSHRGIAVLTRISEAAWEDNRQMFQPSQPLQPGWLKLDRGAVQIEFSRGARVVLEAPAELQLISENEAFLRRGKLSAHVPPPARGFKIAAANFSVVDHGTDFGCIVGEGASEVHVFNGKVSWQPAIEKISGRELKKNQAIRYSNQVVQSIPSSHAEFLSEAELARLDTARESARLAQWHETSTALQNNPAALVYFNFERSGSDSSVLPNRAAAAPPNSDATIIGCDTVDGRWLHKSALEFKRDNDCLRLNVPGEFKALTFLAWIRVDGLANRQQALAMCENFSKGEIHWFLLRNGGISLGEYINTNSPSHGWRAYQTPPIFTEENYGTWAMVVSVCNSITGEIRHYYNGQPVGVGFANEKYRVPLRLDTFEIGNWGVRYSDPRWSYIQWGSPSDAVRNFHGRMDEFAILASAMSPQEIQKLYIEGRPGETIFAAANH